MGVNMILLDAFDEDQKKLNEFTRRAQGKFSENPVVLSK
jgi:hypothetical protein